MACLADKCEALLTFSLIRHLLKRQKACFVKFLDLITQKRHLFDTFIDVIEFVRLVWRKVNFASELRKREPSTPFSGASKSRGHFLFVKKLCINVGLLKGLIATKDGRDIALGCPSRRPLATSGYVLPLGS